MTVIIKEVGSLFDSDAQLYVNAVNCQGISGLGIARAFKMRFPEYHESYQEVCKSGFLQPGLGHLWENFREGSTPRYIYSFPTKIYPQDRTMMKWISLGVRHLKATIELYDIASVAMPAVGCGAGKSDWVLVERLIRYHLNPIACTVTVFAPGSEKKETIMNLSAHESVIFAETILNPPSPNEALQDAAIRYHEEVEKKEYEEVSAAECSECGDIILEDDVDLKDQCYECGSCGVRYSRENNEGTHRCPDCNKFGYKIDGWCCPNCAGVGESEFETYNQCPDCDEYFLPIETHTCE